ncbi:MAG: ABC transporter permease [Clostridia bacterium]|nr:ABC transporter permease [Clostridia bacterium]
MSKSSEVITTVTPKRKLLDFNFAETFRYKDLIFLFVKNDFITRYKQMLLGPLWAVIQPLLTTVVFTVVFGNIAGLPTDGAPKFMFYMCGNVLWTYFSSCLIGASNCFSSNAYLFSKVYFPRLVAPISTAIGNMINSGIQFLIFAGFLVYSILTGGVHPVYSLLWLAVLLVLQVTMLGMGIGLMLSSLTIKYRDLKMLISFGVQLWLYATPIAYATSLVKEKIPSLYGVYMLNPMASVCEAMRKIFLGVGNISIKYLCISLAMSIFFFLLGIIMFNRAEKTFTDKI